MSMLIAPTRIGTPKIGLADVRTDAGAGFFIFVAVFVVALYVSNLNDYYYGKGSDIKPLYFHLMTLGFAGIALLTHQKTIIDKFPRIVRTTVGNYRHSNAQCTGIKLT